MPHERQQCGGIHCTLGRPIYNGGCSKHDPTISATPDQTPSPADPGDAPNTAKHTSLRSLPFSCALVTGTLSHLSSFPCSPTFPNTKNYAGSSRACSSCMDRHSTALYGNASQKHGGETSAALQDHAMLNRPYPQPPTKHLPQLRAKYCRTLAALIQNT